MVTFILVYNPVYPRTPPGATVNQNHYTLLRCKVVFKNNTVIRHYSVGKPNLSKVSNQM